ncbi:serine/threonine-protein kinase [Cellvibrio sp. pealriver]|uniref:serine/threonine-protein kinase n=1 Tax=Cellvibrio sp. pealriver TaxID=1622269 RepID=UPI00069FF449|nr:serine/threonine-protein kinase [Cellvibrio sp. pealriver]
MTDDHRIAKGNSGQGAIQDDAIDSDKTRFRPGDTIIADAPQSPDLTVTHYSASHNHSAGFAQARELVKQSQSGKGTLLKKRFLLEEVLGHGGMGTVYKAKDLRKVEAEDPDPYIATKVLNQDFKDHPDAFVTLQQETAKSQTLAHPNIVTVHDFDRDGDILFMTMELLEGKPLDQLIKAHRRTGLPKEQVWKITRDLCAALAYAHQRQLIHADFKPGNIFVNNDGHAKVLDFGIARAANREAQKHRFDAGQLGALTPAYATVEMVKDEPLGFSDDVYALACVVYEMLAGQHPYNQRSAFEAQQQKLSAKRLDNLSAREWKALHRALALDKSARTSSIAQFADELFPKRSPVVLTAALGLAVVSLVGAGWFGYSQHQAKQQVQKTVQQKITAAQLCFAQSDFSCAIEQALVAVNLDSANNVAAQLLQAAQVAQTAREQESRLQELLVQAQECVAKQDLDCAVLFADKLREADADYPALQLLDQQIHSARVQGEQAAAAQQEMINQQLAVAQNCLIKNDYACVQEQASAILVLEPANAQAIEIRQQANLAQQQQKEIAVKVDKLLADANNCMTKKNYSCAIAKAESAMELDAGNKQAEALRVRAMDTQRKLKETGFTIK